MTQMSGFTNRGNAVSNISNKLENSIEFSFSSIFAPTPADSENDKSTKQTFMNWTNNNIICGRCYVIKITKKNHRQMQFSPFNDTRSLESIG